MPGRRRPAPAPREVAERLRDYPGDGMALRHACRALGIDYKCSVREWVRVFGLLADLIDPDGGEAPRGRAR